MKTIIAIVLTAAVMAAAAFFVTTKFLKPAVAPAGGQSESASAETKEPEDAKAREAEVYLVDKLLINPTGTSGKRYLSTSLGLEVRSKEASEQLRSRDLQVRDLLISIISARTVAELTNPAERENMRREIQGRLNQMLGGEQLTAVYFVDYVMQ